MEKINKSLKKALKRAIKDRDIEAVTVLSQALQRLVCVA